MLPPTGLRRNAGRDWTGPPGSRAWSFSECLGSQTPRGHCVLALAYAAVLPSGFLTPWAPRNKDFEVQCPAYRYPYPTLQVQPYSCTRMARGQSGSLDLLCTTLSSATPSRFYPGANQEFLPSRLPVSLGRRLNPLPLQNLRDRAARKLVPRIRQCALDSPIAPIPVFLCHPDHQSLELARRPRPPWSALASAVVFLSNQSAMPSQQSFRRDERGHFSQQLATDTSRSGC